LTKLVFIRKFRPKRFRYIDSSSLVVNVWDYTGGSLKPAGQKRIPPDRISSGDPDRLDHDDYDNFDSDFVDELFDNDIPPPEPGAIKNCSDRIKNCSDKIISLYF
jgi:hypothetical protein